jgi:hypothetical protein
VGFDVFQASLSGVLLEGDRPPAGHLGEGRPEGVLALVVHQDAETALIVVEGVGAHARRLLENGNIRLA